MLQETSTQPHATPPLLADAPWSRVDFAPPGPWVENEPYDPATPARDGLHVTHLCRARQVDAGSGGSFHATAVRLETSQAAQNESRWSVELDARTRRLTVHWLRVVRDGVRIDQLQRGRMRLLQHETQLERLMLDGRWTLLAVLDDVRPGDIVEAAYTRETHDPIRPGGCEVFFWVPPQEVVGRHRLSVRFEAGRPAMRWLASPDAPEHREETLADGHRRWVWEGVQTVPRDAEPNAPGNWTGQTWVQVSDLPDWPALSERVAAAWAAAGDVSGLTETAVFSKPEPVDAEAITRLVAHMQEEFRHADLDLQSGGWMPSPPSLVARRRQGDGKDLVWLAATVLRGWGVRARPILVGAEVREKVAGMVPMAELLNHAVLEVEWEGRARWFDLTERGQGGGFGGRAVKWFGHGLAVDATDKGLLPQPGERASGEYALRETVLLDTTRGGVSLVEQRVRADGWQADLLRRALREQGLESFAREREQAAQHRHARARRLGELRWRDDIPANVFEIVEVFELTEAAHPEARGLRAIHEVPPGLVAILFPMPEDKPRRAPWAMPFPCEVRHTLTVKAAGLTAGAGRRRRWAEPEFEATQDDTRLNGAWTRVFRFTVLVPEVPAGRVGAYRKALEECLRDAAWRIHLPWGRGRLHRGKGFGELDEVAGSEKPAPEQVAEIASSPAPAASKPDLPAGGGVVAADFKREPGGGRRRRRKEGRSSPQRVEARTPGWVFKVALSVVAIITVGVVRGCLRGP